MLRRKRTEEEDKLLKLLQGIKQPQDGFTTWCEQMLHALNTSTTSSSSALDGTHTHTLTHALNTSTTSASSALDGTHTHPHTTSQCLLV